MDSRPVLSCIVFDVDGTLVDSANDIAIAVNRWRASVEAEDIDTDLVRLLLGQGLFGLLDRAAEGVLSSSPAARMEQAYSGFVAAYADVGTSNSNLYDGVTDALRYWRDQGVALVALTDKPHRLTKDVLERFGILEYFDAIARRGHLDDRGRRVKSSDGGDVFQFVVDQTGAALEETWLVGDGIADVEMANEAGGPYLCVHSGYSTREELLAAGCDLGLAVADFEAADQFLRRMTRVWH